VFCHIYFYLRKNLNSNKTGQTILQIFMNKDLETKKLEKLFSTDGGLRSHISKLIENKIFYDRLKSLEDNWIIFKDVLLSIGILVGDILAIHDIIKKTPTQDVEVKTVKMKNKKSCFRNFFINTYLMFTIDEKEGSFIVVDDSESKFELSILVIILIYSLLETIYLSVDEFETRVFEEGIKFGVMYQKRHNVKSDQYYMRCSFNRKQDPTGKLYNCEAFIYGSMSEGNISLRKINPEHTHQLMTSEAIKLKMSQMKKSIPEKIKEESYKLFINGESTTDIYNLLKKANYPQNDCPFKIDPLRNYLYNRNKEEKVNYENIFEMYEKLNSDQATTKLLKIKTFGEDNNDLRGLSFTFQEQIIYGNFFFQV